jgi:hypothetical protein
MTSVENLLSRTNWTKILEPKCYFAIKCATLCIENISFDHVVRPKQFCGNNLDFLPFGVKLATSQYG